MRNARRVWIWGFVLATMGAAALLVVADQWTGHVPGVATAQPVAPSSTHSSPIAITSDDQFVWSVNPDNDSVSVFNVAHDANHKVAEIPVGKEPWCVAITPDDAKVYVTNMASGTVSVIDAATWNVVKTIKVGTEPFGCALTPDGSRLYVANQSSDDVSVINTRADARGQDHRGRRPQAARHRHHRRRQEGLRDPVPRAGAGRRSPPADPERGRR